jgi:hypothetical protein
LITLNHNPIQGNTNTPLVLNQNIINSSAMEYSNFYSAYCSDNVKDLILPEALNTYLPLVNIPNQVVNPFLMGQLNSYKPLKNYDYKTNRNYNATQVDVKADGKYSAYKEFWKFETGSSKWEPVYSATRTDYVLANPYDRWINKGENTIINPFGMLIETKDAIGLYSSSLYTFNQTLIKAKAVNSQSRLMSFDSFEDFRDYPNLANTINNIADDHIGLKKYSADVVTTYAHTGYKSLKILANNPVLLQRPIREKNCAEFNYVDGAYKPNCNCSYGFSPIANVNYAQNFILSLWIKSPSNTVSNYSTDFELGINNVAVLLANKTNIIDGWQKLEYNVTVPANTAIGNFNITFKNNTSTSADIFVDDFRIHPYNASLVGYVYDPYSLRIMAQLDDRNFATINEYDNEGKLVRNKKETEKGIFTVSENRSSLIKR